MNRTPARCAASLERALEGALAACCLRMVECTAVLMPCGRRCLAGKHIAFVGDSLTRYQYMAFAYFLSKMKRLEKYGGLPGYPSICIETEWMDWPQYYHFSSAIIGSAAQGCGTELCDCLRNGNLTLAQVREFRSLHLTFPDSCTGRHSYRSKSREYLTVSYQQMFAYPDPQTAGQDALHHFELSYQQQPPDVLVLNAGVHLLGVQVPDYNATLASILQAGAAVREKHDTLLLWASTTNGTNGPWVWRDQELQLAAAHSYAQYDVGRVALAAAQQRLGMTWDSRHFLPMVYEHFNDVLLNWLCGQVTS